MKWTISAIVVGSLLLHGTYTYWLFRHYVAIGVKLSDSAVRFERPIENSDLKVLVIGDSSAVGTGAAQPQDSLAGRIGADYPTASITNLGVNGQRLEGLLVQLETMPASEQYDWIVMQIGANDITHMTKFAEIEDRLHHAIELARQHGQHIFVLHGGKIGTSRLLPWFVRWVFNARSYHVRNTYLAEVKLWNNVEYVDIIQAAKPNDPFKQQPAKYYAADFFHPSSDGYAFWYQQLKPLLERQER